MLLHLITVKRLPHLFDTARPLASRLLPFRKLSGLSGREHYPINVLQWAMAVHSSQSELPSVPNTRQPTLFCILPSLSPFTLAARRSVFQASELQIAASIMRCLLGP